jgi:hypothetical protein
MYMAMVAERIAEASAVSVGYLVCDRLLTASRRSPQPRYRSCTAIVAERSAEAPVDSVDYSVCDRLLTASLLSLSFLRE